MCDRFSDFFACNIAATIADRLSVIASITPAIVFNEPVNHVTFYPVSELEVKRVIDACPPKSSPVISTLR